MDEGAGVAEQRPAGAPGTPGVVPLRRERRRPGTSGPARPARSGPSWREVVLGRVLAGRGPADPPSRSGAGGGWRASTRWGPTADQLSLLASLDDAGVRTDRAFDALARAAGAKATRVAAAHVQQRLREGSALSRALREVAVPGHLVTMVRAGERAGSIGPSLRAAADLARRLEGLRAVIRRALVYPAVVLVLGLAIVVVLAVTVVPPIERTFAGLGGELPAPTVLVLRVAELLRSAWAPVVLGAALLSVGGLRRRIPPERFARLRERVPVTGKVQRDLQIAVVAGTTATMLEAGVPLLDVLHTTASVTPPGRVHDALLRSCASIERGERAVADDGLGGVLDEVDREMLHVAETNGLEAVQWRRVAERRMEALEERMRRTGAVLEPLLVVLVGTIVGGAVLALYLPTFRALDLL